MIIPEIDSSAVAGWASSWYSERKNERIMKERIWNECWLAYDCKFGETWADLEDYRSKRYLSLPWQMTESVTSNMVNGVMPSEDWFNILGRTPGDDSGSKLMQALLKWQHYRSGFRNEISEILKQAYIFGNVPIAVDWHEELLDIPDPDAFAAQMAQNQMLQAQGMPVPEAQSRQWPTKTVRKYDGPRIKGGNIFDYVQDMNPSNERMALRGMRFFRTIGYLKNMSNIDSNGYSLYENIEGLANETIFRESSDSLKMMTERQIGIAKMPKDMVELIQYEGDIEIPNGMGSTTFYPNHILVVANRTTVIRFEPNPFYHGRPTWELFRLYEEPNELYGRGGIEPILGINDGIQCRYNQTIEANSLAVNPQFKYKEDGIFDPDQFISAPGMLHKVADPINNILPLQIPSEASLSWNEINFGINQLNLITGSSENFGGDPSATQVSIQAGMSANRTRETLNHINYALLIPILEKEIALNQQLMDEATWVRIVSDTPGQANDPVTGLPFTIQPQQFQVSPEDIVGAYDVIAVGANQTSQNVQKSKDLLQVTTLIAQSPFANAIKGPEFVNEVYRMGGFFDAWKFIKTPEEIQLEQQQQFNQQLRLKGSGMGQKGSGAEGSGPGGVSSPGPQPQPGGLASMAGMAEGPGELPGGPNPDQLAGNRLG
jgi:hypothetical protein